jgi:hypothetical protein
MLFSVFVSLCSVTFAESPLEPYKNYLEWGTYQGQDWSAFPVLPLSRYDTFKAAFSHFEATGGAIIVELGTSRSFTHGGHPGCNSDNTSYWDCTHPENWDWGAGFFTRMVATSLQHCKPEIHTVDIAASHIARCRWMTKEFSSLITYHVESSVDFLRNCNFPKGIDLLYLDTGDMTPIEPTALLQLEEAKIIVERDLLAKNGWILIDDVKNRTPKQFGESSELGKSKYSIPFFLQNGFEIVIDGYQVILQKTGSP